MQGGEIFVPKIPSSRIVDIAEALRPGKPIRIVGVRPGEKLHEVMCPRDDAQLTIEFDDHYVIQPTITFSGMCVTNERVEETGRNVPPGFEYNSDQIRISSRFPSAATNRRRAA